MNFAPQVTIESKTCEGVRFTIRRLSQMLRAQRDMSILNESVRIAELQEMKDAISSRFKVEVQEQAESGQTITVNKIKDAKEWPLDARVEFAKLDREQGALIVSVTKPATVRICLSSIEGLTYSNQPATVDLLLDNGPDELIDEIWDEIQKNFLLTPAQLKNSPSPITSPAVGDGPIGTTTAETANEAASGKTSAVPAISQA